MSMVPTENFCTDVTALGMLGPDTRPAGYSILPPRMPAAMDLAHAAAV